jgi:hypothetical protein
MRADIARGDAESPGRSGLTKELIRPEKLKVAETLRCVAV